MSYDANQAARYNADTEHILPPEEVRLWLYEMAALADGQPFGRVLDIGAGTGFLTSAIKSAGHSVTGLEPSEEMVHRGLATDPVLALDDFVLGDAEDRSVFEAGSFGWVVCRQVLCHLKTPQSTFANWYSWLRPGGRMMLVDGLWPTSSWTPESLQAHPFASLTSAAPVADAAAAACFTVVKAEPFVELDTVRKALWPLSKRRYIVTVTRV